MGFSPYSKMIKDLFSHYNISEARIHLSEKLTTIYIYY